LSAGVFSSWGLRCAPAPAKGLEWVEDREGGSELSLGSLLGLVSGETGDKTELADKPDGPADTEHDAADKAAQAFVVQRGTAGEDRTYQAQRQVEAWC
jgi:hypothetical protein